MGAGLHLMAWLVDVHHVGKCTGCGEWVPFGTPIRGVYICPLCGTFGTPGYATGPEPYRDALLYRLRPGEVQP